MTAAIFSGVVLLFLQRLVSPPQGLTLLALFGGIHRTRVDKLRGEWAFSPCSADIVAARPAFIIVVLKQSRAT